MPQRFFLLTRTVFPLRLIISDRGGCGKCTVPLSVCGGIGIFEIDRKR